MVVMVILSAHRAGGIQGWAGVLWTAAFGIAVCAGSRVVWWLVVTWNALVLAMLLSRHSWLAALICLIPLTLLLAPASRRYVFERDPEPGRASDG